MFRAAEIGIFPSKYTNIWVASPMKMVIFEVQNHLARSDIVYEFWFEFFFALRTV